MSLAERTRNAIQHHPFVHEALRAGVINYTAAARLLDVDGDTDAITTALRRYETELADPPATETPIVRMRRNVGLTTNGEDRSDDPLLTIQSTQVHDGGSATAIIISGGLSARQQGAVLTGLAVTEVELLAVGFDQTAGIVVVEGSAGTTALQTIEAIIRRPMR